MSAIKGARAKLPTFSLDQNTTIKIPKKDDSALAEITKIVDTSEKTSAIPLSESGNSTTTKATTATPLTGELEGLNATMSATEPVPKLSETMNAAISSLRGRRIPSAKILDTSKGFASTRTIVPSTLGLPVLDISTAAPAPTPMLTGFATSTATNITDPILSSFQTPTVPDPRLAFNQLEEQINKCTLELAEQEHFFTEKATVINTSDMVLINNNQKILELNDAVQKVKIDQKIVDHDLEFIATQRMELDESIEPSEKEFFKIPHGNVDAELCQTDLMVENLDSQLKQISVDFKEIIDYMKDGNMDLLGQLDKLFNVHIATLQWFKISLGKIANNLEDIDRMYDILKRYMEQN